MRLRIVLAGVILGLGGLICSGCGSDDTMIKWRCSCEDACAATEADALSLSPYCSTFGDPSSCTPTGDICACPGGASKCEISF